jgi:hypothetical protein
VLAMGARGPAELAAAVSLAQILMHMTVYCRLIMSNIFPPPPLPAAQSLLSDPCRIAALCLLARILKLVTVNSVLFCDIHLSINWHAWCAARRLAAAVFLPRDAVFGRTWIFTCVFAVNSVGFAPCGQKRHSPDP